MNPPISDKPVVKHIIEHCRARGVKQVVLSPGSRNAPFLLSFPASGFFRCKTVVDERSAAYFALGLAIKTHEPVVLVCTSGTAALNYAPAIAEAWYQQIPLIVITADRPPELIDQADGQTIRQTGIYQNFIRYTCQMPVDQLTAAETRLTDRMLNEAFLHALGDVKGPVHINVPFREPLYGLTEFEEDFSVPVIPVNVQGSPDPILAEELRDELKNYEQILLLLGAMPVNPEMQKVITRLVEKGVVVLAETLSNVNVPGVIKNMDRVLAGIPETKSNRFKPQLLVTLDVPVLSRMVKRLIRTHSPLAHWHFCNQNILVDTYDALTRQIKGPALEMLTLLAGGLEPLSPEYSRKWQDMNRQTAARHDDYLRNLPWSDLKMFEVLAKKMPEDQEIHLSNSTPVRYAQLFEWKDSQVFYGNRGTSGIDGCVSTAAGAACEGERPVTLITGDLGFFYDTNGLWHGYLPDNFRVIVINNGGGGIFRFIPGPAETDALEPYFEATQNYDCRGICQTFGLKYFNAGNEEELKKVLEGFWKDDSNPALLEIFTPREINGTILKRYFNGF